MAAVRHDLAFPYVYPDEYKKAKELLKSKSAETLLRLEKFMKSVKTTLAEGGLTNFQTDYRQKGLYSLSKKIVKKEGDIENIYDTAEYAANTLKLGEFYYIQYYELPETKGKCAPVDPLNPIKKIKLKPD